MGREQLCYSMNHRLLRGVVTKLRGLIALRIHTSTQDYKRAAAKKMPVCLCSNGDSTRYPLKYQKLRNMLDSAIASTVEDRRLMQVMGMIVTAVLRHTQIVSKWHPTISLATK